MLVCQRKAGGECFQQDGKKGARNCQRSPAAGTEKQLRYTFRYAEKLHLQKDFQQVLKAGRRLAHPALFIYVYANPSGTELRRMGLITSRKIGKAVVRNRIKRLLRESFRLNKHLLKPGTDTIFIPRAGAVGLSYAQISSIVLSLWQRAGVLSATDRGES